MGLQHVVNISAPDNDFIDTILTAASELWVTRGRSLTHGKRALMSVLRAATTYLRRNTEDFCCLLVTSPDFAAMFGKAVASLPDVCSLSLAVAEDKEFKCVGRKCDTVRTL